uniref:Uncharacterized protein n=1 Tax=Anguilla anguilla TaxID=7936 RepID=A0A0E9XQS5_ANGAN
MAVALILVQGLYLDVLLVLSEAERKRYCI